MVDDGPIEDREFTAAMAAFAPFEARPHVAVAVSGGADSMALCWLAHRWAAARGGAILALLVDHALRADSAAEARETRDRLLALGIRAEILTRSGGKPASRVQETARRDRYRLLEDACRRRAVLHLLLGHHAEDQRETVAMRAARPGVQEIGLAGMAAIVETSGLRLLRPLLAFPPRRLRATLRAIAQPWIEDPSNRDARFERVRQRLSGGGPTPEAIGRSAESRRHREAALAAAAARLVRPHPLGFVTIGPRGGLVELEPATLGDLLRRALWTVSGAAFPPSVAAAAALAKCVTGPGFRGATLAGCEIRPRALGLAIVRELRAAERSSVPAGPAPVLWDGRFTVAVSGCTEGTCIGALGSAGVTALRRAAAADALFADQPTKILATLPAVRVGNAIVAVGIPEGGGGTSGPIRCRWTPRQKLSAAIF